MSPAVKFIPFLVLFLACLQSCHLAAVHRHARDVDLASTGDAELLPGIDHLSTQVQSMPLTALDENDDKSVEEDTSVKEAKSVEEVEANGVEEAKTNEETKVVDDAESVEEANSVEDGTRVEVTEKQTSEDVINTKETPDNSSEEENETQNELNDKDEEGDKEDETTSKDSKLDHRDENEEGSKIAGEAIDEEVKVEETVGNVGEKAVHGDVSKDLLKVVEKIEAKVADLVQTDDMEAVSNEDNVDGPKVMEKMTEKIVEKEDEKTEVKDVPKDSDEESDEASENVPIVVKPEKETEDSDEESDEDSVNELVADKSEGAGVDKKLEKLETEASVDLPVVEQKVKSLNVTESDENVKNSPAVEMKPVDEVNAEDPYDVSEEDSKEVDVQMKAEGEEKEKETDAGSEETVAELGEDKVDAGQDVPGQSVETSHSEQDKNLNETEAILTFLGNINQPKQESESVEPVEQGLTEDDDDEDEDVNEDEGNLPKFLGNATEHAAEVEDASRGENTPVEGEGVIVKTVNHNVFSSPVESSSGEQTRVGNQMVVESSDEYDDDNLDSNPKSDNAGIKVESVDEAGQSSSSQEGDVKTIMQINGEEKDSYVEGSTDDDDDTEQELPIDINPRILPTENLPEVGDNATQVTNDKSSSISSILVDGDEDDAVSPILPPEDDTESKRILDKTKTPESINEILSTNQSDGKQADASDTNSSSTGSFIVLGAIMVTIAVLLVYTVVKSRRQKRKRRLRAAQEGESGTEMKEVEKMIPKTKNGQTGNGVVTERDLLMPQIAPEVAIGNGRHSMNVDQKENVAVNGVEGQNQEYGSDNSLYETGEWKQGEVPLETTRIKMYIDEDSIPKTPIRIVRSSSRDNEGPY